MQVTGGVGPAWYFDGQYLYVRVVNLGCYNQNQRKSCQANGFYTQHGASVPNILEGFSCAQHSLLSPRVCHSARAVFRYIVNVTSCPGCSVQSKLGNVRFFSAPDTPPSAKFATSYGAAAQIPNSPPPPKV